MVLALMAVGMSSAQAITTTGNKLVMLDQAGGLVGADYGVNFTWNGTYNTNVATAVSNATLAPNAGSTFFGYTWTAHNVEVYSAANGAPTTYNFTYPATTNPFPSPAGAYTVTVGAGQVAFTMLFDWIGTSIPIVEVCGPGKFSGVGYTDQTVWDCASVDGNGDGIPGIPIAVGPFQTFNASFNLMGLVAPGGQSLIGGYDMNPPVPVPAAAWLLGSGLLGLIGATRKYKAM